MEVSGREPELSGAVGGGVGGRWCGDGEVGPGEGGDGDGGEGCGEDYAECRTAALCWESAVSLGMSLRSWEERDLRL